jgi:hypothetical protein
MVLTTKCKRINDNTMTLRFASTPDALDAFVDDWHAGRVSRGDWTHAAHVAVCGYYAHAMHPAATFAVMKAGILAHARAHGIVHTPTSGYHETLTRLWTLAIAAHVRRSGARTRWEAACAAVDRFGEDRELPRRCYTFDVVNDVTARAAWIAPDRDVPGLLDGLPPGLLASLAAVA